MSNDPNINVLAERTNEMKKSLEEHLKDCKQSGEKASTEREALRASVVALTEKVKWVRQSNLDSNCSYDCRWRERCGLVGY